MLVSPKLSHPKLTSEVLFRLKATLLQVKRGIKNQLPSSPKHYTKGTQFAEKPVLAESRTPLWTSPGAPAEKHLQAGKIHNLRIALKQLDGIELPAGEVFSFWAQLGQPTRWKGYVAGRELREGCLIPSVGGGRCQLSNALYDAALKAGFDIVERHAHSRVVPGSLAEIGRDATVFWNYVDLRFRAGFPFRIEAFLTSDSLVVRFRGDATSSDSTTPTDSKPARLLGIIPGSCASCGVYSCHRNVEREAQYAQFGKQAFLVDEFWPEFDEYLSQHKSDQDVLCLPIDGNQVKKANYAWKTGGFGQVQQARLVALWRAWSSRSLASQGAARQRGLLDADQELAAAFAKSLTYDITHLTCMQNLLPFLWMDGHLGGRTFDVLMTRLPLDALHQQLDQGRKLHPESPTLGDFRADAALLKAEREALRQARRIITPHSHIAELFPTKAVLLDWKLPQSTHPPVKGKKVAFPASTVGRKGAYELREVAEKLGLEVVTFGSEFEGEDFWGSIQTQRRSFSPNWLNDIGVVVLPAFVEHKPRKLLEAIAAGIPVIASAECGLKHVHGVTTIPAGDVSAMCEIIEYQLNIK